MTGVKTSNIEQSDPLDFDELIDTTPTATFGKVLTALAQNDDDIVALSADLKLSTGLKVFDDTFPDRCFDTGVAEQNMYGICAGMATCGLKPFAATFACFASMRACEQVRTDICYPNLNVKVIGTHAGLSFGPGGTTHHATEDIAIMRSLANMTVIVPADSIETAKAVVAAAEYEGPCFIRLPRGPVPYSYKNHADCHFEIGKATTMRPGQDVTIISAGTPLSECIKAAELLAKESLDVRVINMSTIKPIDRQAVISAAQQTGAIVTVEEHNICGGLGSAVAEVTSETEPVPMKMLGIPDIYSAIGPSPQLYEKYGLTSSGIAEAVRNIARTS